MGVPSPSSVPRVSATAVPPAPVPHTARGPGERPVAYAIRSPRLNTQLPGWRGWEFWHQKIAEGDLI